MDPNFVIGELTVAFGGALKNFVRDIALFRVGCKIADRIAVLIGGWVQPLLFSGAGVRLLRGWPFAAAASLFIWSGVFYWSGMSPHWPTILLILAAILLAGADWLAAKRRERRREYVYSRFIGWPRLIPVDVPGSFYLPALFLVAVGLAMFSWEFDVMGGLLLMASGLAVLARLYITGALQREDVLDLLDNAWLAVNRNAASQEIAGTDAVQASVPVAVAVTTADLVRRWSV